MSKIGKTFALFLTLTIAMSCLTLLTVKPANAQSKNQVPLIQWQKTFSGYYKDHVLESSNLIQTSDGGYAFMDLGYTYQNFLEPATIFKVDSQGNLLWSKTIAQFSGSGIIQTNDNGYEISGWWYLPNSSSAIAPTLIKLNTQVNIQWTQNYTTLPDLGVNYTTYTSSNYNSNQAGGNIRTSDNGSIYWTYGNIIKTDSSNNTQWTKTFTYPVVITNSSAPLLLTSVTETSDGAIAALGIAPAGYSTFPTQGIMYLVKLEPFLPVPSPTQLPTPIPTVPELSWLVIAPLLVGSFAVALVFRHRKASSLNKVAN